MYICRQAACDRRGRTRLARQCAEQIQIRRCRENARALIASRKFQNGVASPFVGHDRLPKLTTNNETAVPRPSIKHRDGTTGIRLSKFSAYLPLHFGP